jgi:quercetin 2,3-dioxygenase
VSDIGGSVERAAYEGTAAAVAEPESVLLPGHDVPLGRYTTVRRLLPDRQRRMVGAWCFADHFGPVDVSGQAGMQLPPHPHTGLQTVTWLVDGEILHRDSLGSEQTIVPGQLNLMTSGHGIAHSEQSPQKHPPGMHGLQLWVALPDTARHGAARFEHYGSLPVSHHDGAIVTVVVGEFGPVRSPAVVHTPLVGLEVLLPQRGGYQLPMNREFEYGVLVLSGAVNLADVAVSAGSLLYLSQGRSEITITADGQARLFVLGGEPFDEPLVMWWNFVGRTHEEIVQARDDWMAGRRFGTVPDSEHDPLPAPAMPTVRLKARDREGHTFG